MGLRLKVVDEAEKRRHLMPVPRTLVLDGLIADLVKHVHRRSESDEIGKMIMKVNGFALLPTQRIADVLRDGDEVTVSRNRDKPVATPQPETRDLAGTSPSKASRRKSPAKKEMDSRTSRTPVTMTSFQAAMEAKEVVARGKPPSTTPLWPPPTSDLARAKPLEQSYHLQQHGDIQSLRHPVLGELEVPKGQQPEDFINRKLKTLRKAIRKQVEYYFSDLNWSKDEYLRSLADSDGFVAIQNIMDFKLLKQICSDFETIRDSLQTSEDLQLSACGNRLRKAGTSLR
eukprot:s327_g37.t1